MTSLLMIATYAHLGKPRLMSTHWVVDPKLSAVDTLRKWGTHVLRNFWHAQSNFPSVNLER